MPNYCPCNQCNGTVDPPDEPLSETDRAEMEDYMAGRAEDRAERLRDEREQWGSGRDE